MSEPIFSVLNGKGTGYVASGFGGTSDGLYVPYDNGAYINENNIVMFYALSFGNYYWVLRPLEGSGGYNDYLAGSYFAFYHGSYHDNISPLGQWTNGGVVAVA